MRAKELIRNSVILFFYLSGLSALRKFYLKKKYGPLTRVICIHRVWDKEKEKFRKRIAWLKENYNLVHLDDFFEDNLSRKKTNIALTFDDGYKNWVRNVIPILKEFNIPATFFVNSSFVGLSEKKSLEFCRDILKLTPEIGLSWEDVRAIDSDGFVLGGHTRNHINLGVNHDLKYIEDEIIEDKNKIEDYTGHEIKYFAYPFGSSKDFCSRAVEIIRKAGYKAAFTIIPGFNFKNTNHYMLYRDSLDVSVSDLLCRAWLEGSYDIFKRQLIKQEVY